MRAPLARLARELGPAGRAALALAAAATLFSALVLAPLERRNQLAQQQQAAARAAGAGASGGQLAALYAFLGRREPATDWLAKLHGIGVASGVELRSASYRTPAEAGPVERYEITLPVSGSYAQLRQFLRRALAEIPVLSLDQMTLRRGSRNDGVVHAELRLTLHRMKP